MKKLLFAAIAAASACASGQEIDLRNYTIASSNDVAVIASIPEWKRGVDTNGVTISVCVGMANNHIGKGPICCQMPLFRDLKFNSDGRLLYISKVQTESLSFFITSSGRRPHPVSGLIRQNQKSPNRNITISPRHNTSTEK